MAGGRFFHFMLPDHPKKIAALSMLTTGRITVSEAARLVKCARQSVQGWMRTRDIDAMNARRKWIAKEWQAELRRGAPKFIIALLVPALGLAGSGYAASAVSWVLVRGRPDACS